MTATGIILRPESAFLIPLCEWFVSTQCRGWRGTGFESLYNLSTSYYTPSPIKRPPILTSLCPPFCMFYLVIPTIVCDESHETLGKLAEQDQTSISGGRERSRPTMESTVYCYPVVKLNLNRMTRNGKRRGFHPKATRGSGQQ